MIEHPRKNELIPGQCTLYLAPPAVETLALSQGGRKNKQQKLPTLVRTSYHKGVQCQDGRRQQTRSVCASLEIFKTSIGAI